MKICALCMGVFLVAFFAGCDWSPPHDNPLDPESSQYDAPPTVAKAWIEVHCQLRELDVCYMTICADFNDAEGISSRDSAWAYFEENLLGGMNYESVSDRFALSVYFGSDTLDSSLSYYLFKDFSVEFRDEAGNRCRQSTQILNPISHLYGYPEPGYPPPGDSIIDNPRPHFLWAYTTEPEFTFRVTCTGINFFWEVSDIPKDCTSVWMGPEDSLAVSLYSEPYVWTVTAVDNGGNTATSTPIKFWVRP